MTVPPLVSLASTSTETVQSASLDETSPPAVPPVCLAMMERTVCQVSYFVKIIPGRNF